MKKLSVATAVLTIVAFSSLAQAYTVKYRCVPETAYGKEVVRLTYNVGADKATLTVDDKVVPGCKNVPTRGDLVDYGKAIVKIKCDTGIIKLIQNYDETALEIDALKLGLSDTTYMCI